MVDESKEAQRCFEENLRLLSDSAENPEKYNLYQGLLNLSLSMQRMELEIKSIQREVSFLGSSLR